MTGTWSDLNNQPGVNIDTMLLLTDGRVLCHDFQSKNWHTLTPPDSGDYRDGHWDSVEALPDNSNIPTSFGGPTNAPTFFASAVLADGRVLLHRIPGHRHEGLLERGPVGEQFVDGDDVGVLENIDRRCEEDPGPRCLGRSPQITSLAHRS